MSEKDRLYSSQSDPSYLLTTDSKKETPSQKNSPRFTAFTPSEIGDIRALRQSLDREREEKFDELTSLTPEEREAALGLWQRETYEERLGLNRLENQVFLQENFPQRYRPKEESRER